MFAYQHHHEEDLCQRTFLASLRGKGPYDDIGRTGGVTGYDEPPVFVSCGQDAVEVKFNFVMH
jgi:hypothetical protein